MMRAFYFLILHALYVNGEGSNTVGYTSIGTANNDGDVHQVDNTVSFYPNELFSPFHEQGRRSKKRKSSHETVSIADKFPGVAKIVKFNESDDMTPDLSAPEMPSNDVTSRTEGFFMDTNKPVTLDDGDKTNLQSEKRTHSVSSSATGQQQQQQQQPEPETKQLAGFTSMDSPARINRFRPNPTVAFNIMSMPRRRRRKHRHKRRRVDQRRNMFNLKQAYNGMVSFLPFNGMASSTPGNRMASNIPTNSLGNNIPGNSMASYNPVNSMASYNPVNSMGDSFPSSRMASYHSGNRITTNNFGSNRLGNDYADNAMAINFLANKLAGSIRSNNMASKLPVNRLDEDQYDYMKKKSALERRLTKEHGKHHSAKKS